MSTLGKYEKSVVVRDRETIPESDTGYGSAVQSVPLVLAVITHINTQRRSTDMKQITSAPVYCVPQEINPRYRPGRQNALSIKSSHTCR